jgi:hypothetical protein
MGAPLRLRDALKLISPWWLSDRRESGKTAGYRFNWSVVSALDTQLEGLLQGMYAAWPGAGTPTALPYIGRARGVVRGMADTNEEYAAKLRGWLKRAEALGSQYGIARELQDYVAGHPRVRVVNRHGHWLTLNADGTIERAQAAWDWDSVSNPERAGYWSDQWAIVYTSAWPYSGTWGDGRTWGGRDGSIGHLVGHTDREALHNLLATAKSAHSKIRAVIWTTDPALFDPAVPLSCPDGTWGQWSLPGSSPRVAGGRIRTTCRYWEPE